MEKRLLIIPIVLLLTLATVSCAGCPNVVTVSPSPTATVSASPTTTIVTTNATPANMSAYLEGLLTDQGYSILKPLTKGSSSVTGNDIYTGTVAYGSNTVNIQFEICKSVYETQVRYRSYVNGFINEGYNTTSAKVDRWAGQDANGYGAVVSLNTQNQVVELAWI